jgi:hypothetical protein
MTDTSWAALSFEARQERWDGRTRHFRQHHGRNDRPSVWEIRIDGDRVHTRYGLLDGQMQETDYQGKLKNKGKKNEITPAQDALAEARRDCRKKWKFEGYDEYVKGSNIDRRNENVSVDHLLTSLPGSFCLYKPENNLYDQKKLFQKADSGGALYTLKRDGIAKLIVKDWYGNIRIYSRRALEWSDTEGPTERDDGTLDYSTVKPWALRFPQLVAAVAKLNLPNNSMIACELIWIDPATGLEKFPIASGFTKGHTERALEDQKRLGEASLYWWDIPFFGGEDWLHTKPVRERYDMIHQIWQQYFTDHHLFVTDVRDPTIRVIEPINISHFKNVAAAEEKAKELKIEGWVVVDPDAIYGDRGWNLKGKPDRPSTCAKLKTTGEDDFIAYFNPDKKDPVTKKEIGSWGTGDNEHGKKVTLPDGSQVIHGGIGSIALYQYNSKGELVFISNCSSGMDYSFQSRLRPEHFPFVCKCEYKGRSYIADGEKTNALRHPVFVNTRTDKSAAECVNARLDVIED